MTSIHDKVTNALGRGHKVPSHLSKRWAWLRTCRSDLPIAFHTTLNQPRPDGVVISSKQNQAEQPETALTFVFGSADPDAGVFAGPALAVAVIMAHIEDHGL